MDLVKPDPGLICEHPEPQVYRCRKCRRIVASRSNLITHKAIAEDPETPFESPVAKPKEKKPAVAHFLTTLHNEEAGNSAEPDAIVELVEQVIGTSLSEKSLSEREPQICTKTFFVEPMTWMKEVINHTEGKLYCPKCNSKLGNFSWVLASKCPCGIKVQPSFYLVPSKIEFSTVVQNIVQVTV